MIHFSHLLSLKGILCNCDLQENPENISLSLKHVLVVCWKEALHNLNAVHVHFIMLVLVLEKNCSVIHI